MHLLKVRSSSQQGRHLGFPGQVMLPGQIARHVLHSGFADQSRLLGLISQGGGAGGGRQIVWNDHRQFDGTISAAERELIRQDTLQIIAEVTNA